MNTRCLSIAPNRLHDRMATGDEVTVTGVRSPTEYRTSHLSGAVSLSPDELAATVDTDLITADITRRCGMARLLARMASTHSCGLRSAA